VKFEELRTAYLQALTDLGTERFWRQEAQARVIALEAALARERRLRTQVAQLAAHLLNQRRDET
jgi:hypothetical protein